jgi:copper chaperone CopZ
MFELHVPEMKSEACAAKIRSAVAGVDSGARCDIDLGTNRVKITSAMAPVDFVEAMEDVGYMAQLFGAGLK